MLLQSTVDIKGCGQPTPDYKCSCFGHRVFVHTVKLLRRRATLSLKSKAFLPPQDSNSTFAFNCPRKTQSFAPCDVLSVGLLPGTLYCIWALPVFLLVCDLIKGRTWVLIISASSGPTLKPGTE